MWTDRLSDMIVAAHLGFVPTFQRESVPKVVISCHSLKTPLLSSIIPEKIQSKWPVMLAARAAFLQAFQHLDESNAKLPPGV
jgi:hypothetical protein